jgi:hypothetical protein
MQEVLEKATALLEVAMPRARFLVSPKEIRALHRALLPAELIPFLQDPQQTQVDYYCIDKGSPLRIVVFAVHAVVAEWPDPESWLTWLRKQPCPNDRG